MNTTHVSLNSTALMETLFPEITNVPKFYNLAKSAAHFSLQCYENPKDCLKETALNGMEFLWNNIGKRACKWLAYDGSRYIADSTIHTTRWAAKQVVDITDSALNITCNSLGTVQPPFKETVRDIYSVVIENGQLVEKKVTDYITPNATAVYEEMLQTPEATAEPFSALHLLGPAVLMGICTQKAKINSLNAIHHFKLLLTGKRQLNTSYTVPTYENTMKGPNTVTFAKTTNYTSLGLIKDTLIETLFATLWMGGAHITYEAIVDALKAAGNDDVSAQWIAQALFATTVVSPLLYRGLGKAFKLAQPLTPVEKAMKVIKENDPGRILNKG